MVERLFKYLSDNEISDADLARLLDKAPQYVSQIKRRNSFGLTFLLELLELFPSLDVKWLLTGISANSNDLVEEGRIKYKPSATKGNKACNDCLKKDELINAYTKLCESQSKTIERLEAELLSLSKKISETG